MGVQTAADHMIRHVSDAQHAPSAVLLVPVKAFGRAKGRLSSALTPSQRVGLARAMADVVIGAAGSLAVTVVCDDDEVAGWARQRGASVCWTPGLDLNGALGEALTQATEAGTERVVIAHADLPFASGLADLAVVGEREVVIAPDRHGDGTNVLSIPTAHRFKLGYGPGSFAVHCAQARDLGLELVELADPALGWDVDEPADLEPPAELGTLPQPALAAPLVDGDN